MSADRVMEAALRHDVAECERRVRLAAPKPVVSSGKLLMRGSILAAEVAQRDLDRARARLEHWLAGRGR